MAVKQVLLLLSLLLLLLCEFGLIDCSGAGTVPMAADCGAEFFGLAHPTVQYLIQSCAGARKCVNYRGARFELSHGEADAYCEEDASVNALLFDRLPTAIASVKTEPS